MTASSKINQATRSAAIAEMQGGELDILIVGGGITGVGAALDAASRGLRVGVVEKEDIGSGTSSKSSKMIHGGLRYLEQLRFGLVREALHERGVLLGKIAPHLVRPVPFLYPLKHSFWERLYVGAGVFLYDRLGGAKQLPGGRHLSRKATAAAAPALRPDRYVGGIQFWDAQEDDARYTLFVARTAAAHGAIVATRVRADSLLVEDYRVVGIRATDTESGSPMVIRARHIVSATGAWTGKFLDKIPSLPFQVRPSKGVHIVLPKSSIEMETGLLSRTETGLLFVIPWEGYWLVGDTDSDWKDDPDALHATSSDVDELLARLNSQLSTPVRRDQILGVFAGLRPLVASGHDKDSRDVSRAHTIETPIPGLSVICGGKFTTYRKMSSDVIDAVIKEMGEHSISRSATDRIVLVGGEGYSARFANRREVAKERGLSISQVERLLGRYGSLIDDLFSLIDSRPELGAPLPGGSSLLGAEIVYACAWEGAMHLDDILERRTRLAICQHDGGIGDLAVIADLMCRELNWSDERRRSEIDRYCRQNDWAMSNIVRD